MKSTFILIAFIGIWVAAAMLIRKYSKSKIMIIGGGFVAATFGLVLVFQAFESGEHSNKSAQSQSSSAAAAAEDDIKTLALGLLWSRKGAGLETSCEKLDASKMIEHITTTAGKLNHPANIVGLTFNCLSSVSGSEPWKMYVGWMQGPTYMECIHWNKDREAVINNGWIECGGLNANSPPIS